MPVFDWLHRNMPVFDWLLKNMPIIDWLHRNMPVFDWLHRNMPVFDWRPRNMPVFDWLLLETCRDVQSVRQTEAIYIHFQVILQIVDTRKLLFYIVKLIQIEN